MKLFSQRPGARPATGLASQRAAKICWRSPAPPLNPRTRLQAASTAVSGDLLTWLDTLGVESSKLGVRLAPGGGGLVAAKPVAKGETLASIPDAAWITKDTAKQSAIGAYVEDLEPWLAVALLLLHARGDPASPLLPYLSSLPKEAASPVVWTNSELAELQGTQLAAAVEGYRAFFERRYVELEAALFAPNPAVFPPEHFTLEKFLWAACTVRARSHAPLDGDEMALVPLADMTGHAKGQGAGVGWALKSAGIFNRGKALAVEAERALAEGEPITMDFGPGRTEGSILLDHGVTAATEGTFALTVALPEDDRFFDDKIDILELAGLQQSQEFVLRAGAGTPESLLPMLRLVNVQGGDAFLLESIFRDEVWGHMQLPISEDNEQAVCQSMVDGCAAALEGYPTSVDEDIAALKRAAPGSRLAAAVTVRMGEKEALAAAQASFANRLERLNEMEFYAERRLKRLGLLDKEGRPTDWESFFDDGIA